MKPQIWLLSLVLLGNNVRAQYPAETPGDTDYLIYGVHWPLDVEYTGTTWAHLPDCNNFHTTLNFSYPSRETDPPGTDHFTLMKYQVYKQNYLTGAFSLAYAQDSIWIMDNVGGAINSFIMAANSQGFDVEPFHLYYIKIWTRKGHYKLSIVMFIDQI